MAETCPEARWSCTAGHRRLRSPHQTRTRRAVKVKSVAFVSPAFFQRLDRFSTFLLGDLMVTAGIRRSQRRGA